MLGPSFHCSVQLGRLSADGFYLNPNTSLTVNFSGVKETGPKHQILVGTPALVVPSDHNDLMRIELQPSKP
ncbi:hypothetical protein EYZ11_012418 [Aspergillus tanneri]|uniref:Uncharacterized protein n=1 Tax=Aspergillus tanneri TaxID=1220188 RepID=A0A4S3J0A5_9EURO|nr:hypothetical protein EYZ11_012418 [Aspergillus tanneri]